MAGVSMILTMINIVFVCFGSFAFAMETSQGFDPASAGNTTVEIQEKINSIRAYLQNPSFRPLITKDDFDFHKREILELEVKKALILARNSNKNIQSIMFIQKHKPLKYIDEEFHNRLMTLCDEVVSLDDYISNSAFKKWENETEIEQIGNRLQKCFKECEELRDQGLADIFNMRLFKMRCKTNQANQYTNPFSKPFTVDDHEGVLYVPSNMVDDLNYESEEYTENDIREMSEVLNGCQQLLYRIIGYNEEIDNHELNNNNAN